MGTPGSGTPAGDCRVRFAPSPTGHLHVGNARTALFNWLLARRRRGVLILRIEDTDLERSTAASEAAILDDLRWLGLSWDEGPDVGGPHGPYRQSERLAIYQVQARRLLNGGQAYYCFCSVGQLEEDRRQARDAGEQPRYVGRCRQIGAADAAARVARGEPAAIRFRIAPGPDVAFDDLVRGHVRFSREVLGDPVIVRSDGQPAYNFAVVVDDVLMRVSDVIRGEDHISNTPRQLLLYEALGHRPPRFAHLALVLGPDHAPLSKRHGATSVAEFRARGYLPEALVNYLALLGWSPGDNDEILPLEVLATRFAVEDVGKRAGVFDPDKLAWVNRHYLKQAAPARLARLVEPFLAASGFSRGLGAEGLAYVAAYVVPMVAGAVNRLEEAPTRVRFLFEFDPRAILSQPDAQATFDPPDARAVVAVLADELRRSGPLGDRDAFRALAARIRERTGQKARRLFHPIRVALTGEDGGPELDLAVPAIDAGHALDSGAGLAPVASCRQRAEAVHQALAERG